MIAAGDATLVLLAAGRSIRFGETDKLEQPVAGTPLGLHIVAALETVPFRRRVAVTAGTRIDYAGLGFDVVDNPDPGAGLSGSVRRGVERARATGAAALVIVLADMPRITAGLIHRLLDAADGPGAVVASSDGGHPRPPALFGEGRFDALMTLDGDAGARDLIRAGRPE